MAALLPVMDDEAYYWVWSRRLAWSYPDHPPMVAVLVALGTRLAGDGAIGIRWPFLVLSAPLPVLTFGVGRALFDARTGVRAALVVSILPIVATASTLAFPDGPLGTCWLLALWTGWYALRRGGWWWLPAGAAVGAAVLSKLTALLLAAGLAGAWLTGPWRRSLRDPWWYVGVAAAAGLVIPAAVWNAGHGWPTVRTALAGPVWITPRLPAINLALFAASQLGYFGPIAPWLVAAAGQALRRAAAPAWRYLAWTTLPLMGAVVVSALAARAKPHWPSPAYLSAAVALGALWPQLRPAARRGALVAAGLTAALTVATLTVAGVVLMVDPYRAAIREGNGRWDGLAAAAAAAARSGPRPAFILIDGYQAASQLTYRLWGRVPVTTLHDYYALLRRPGEFIGQDAVYVDVDGGEWNRALRLYCRDIRRVGPFALRPGQEAVLYRCRSFAIYRGYTAR